MGGGGGVLENRLVYTTRKPADNSTPCEFLKIADLSI